MKFKDKRIVIVGAGISGLTAALTLYKNGFSNVVVLEARNRLGGRIHTIRTGEFTFEAGAQWIQEGLESVFKSMSNGKIELLTYPAKFSCFHEEQKLHIDDTDAVENAYDKFLEIFDEADDDSSNLIKYGDLLSLMRAKWSEYNVNDQQLPTKIVSQIFQNLCFAFRTYDGCNCLADMSAYSNYKKVGDESLQIKGSLSFLIQFLANSFPSQWIKLNHKMKKLFWKNNNSNSCLNQDVKMLVSDSNGNEYELAADHVIVTIPLGYLKKHHQDIFSPQLPEDKITAINRIGFGSTNKIILCYKKPFWSKDVTELFFIWKYQEEQNRPWWKSVISANIFEDVENGKFYIVIFICGDESEELEKLSHKEVGLKCAEIFQNFIGLDETPIPDFTYVSKWCSDPLTYGSYSFSKVECSDEDHSALARPLPDRNSMSPYRLLFAGEATHNVYFSTIHGGYFSGKREAERLVEYYL